MLTLDPKKVPVLKLHGYLLSAIAPRPIAFASTVDEDGKPNLAPFSFFNIFSANPPIAVFSPARRGTNNTTKHTYENVKKVPEVVINVVNFDMVQQCSLASVEYAQGVSEFEKAGLTPVASDLIRPFRVQESPVQLECLVKEVIELGHEGGAGNLVICEVIRMHISKSVLDENGKIDSIKLDLVARCGGNWYSRANRDSLFEIHKPGTKIGMGMDQIPEDIKCSKVLSGNDLAQLAGVEELPNETDVNEYKLIELSDLFIDLEDDSVALENSLHERAKDLLEKGKVEDAWLTLLTFNNG